MVNVHSSGRNVQHRRRKRGGRGGGASLFWKGPSIAGAPQFKEHIVLVNDQSSGSGSSLRDQCIVLLKLTTDRHEASRGFSATARLLVYSPCPVSTTRWAVPCFNHMDIRKYFFSLRVINRWNSLPDEVVLSSSIKFFQESFTADP